MIDLRDIPVRIQILAVKEEAGATASAVAAAEKGRPELAEIAHEHGAEALLVCPAPDGFVEDGFNLVVASRFGEPLDEEAAVLRRLDLSTAIDRALHVRTVTFDLDEPLSGFLAYIDPMLISPYRDEIGLRSSPVRTA
jgi:hypothetical protein